jgi:hypothetical protein
MPLWLLVQVGVSELCLADECIAWPKPADVCIRHTHPVLLLSALVCRRDARDAGACPRCDRPKDQALTYKHRFAKPCLRLLLLMLLSRAACFPWTDAAHMSSCN